MIETPSVDDMMTAYGVEAVDFVRSQFDVERDYSEASVELVVEILEELHGTIPKGLIGKTFGKKPSREQIERLANLFGGYVGEVMRRHWGGKWKIGSQAFPGEDIVTLELSKGGDVWPHLRAGNRMTGGDEYDIWHSYQVMREQCGPVAH